LTTISDVPNRGVTYDRHSDNSRDVNYNCNMFTISLEHFVVIPLEPKVYDLWSQHHYLQLVKRHLHSRHGST